MKNIRQVGFRLLQIDFSALDSAHVQHVIDEAEQVLAGGQNLGKIIFDLFLIRGIGRSKGGESDDCIHGSTNIVRHIAQKYRFRFGCLFSHIQCILQNLASFLFFLFSSVNHSGRVNETTRGVFIIYQYCFCGNPVLFTVQLDREFPILILVLLAGQFP